MKWCIDHTFRIFFSLVFLLHFLCSLHGLLRLLFFLLRSSFGCLLFSLGILQKTARKFKNTEHKWIELGTREVWFNDRRGKPNKMWHPASVLFAFLLFWLPLPFAFPRAFALAFAEAFGFDDFSSLLSPGLGFFTAKLPKTIKAAALAAFPLRFIRG